jgi:hypothetical protein
MHENESPTTTDLLSSLISPDLMRLLDEATAIRSELSDKYPDLAHILDSPLQHRAAFAIPQLCIELSYHALAGRFMPSRVRWQAMQYSLLCLATAAGDDLVDLPFSSLDQRVNLACLSLVLGHTAYLNLISRATEFPFPMVLSALSDMLARITSAACKELTYSAAPGFTLEDYMSLARDKTTSYTAPACVLASALLDPARAAQSIMREIGVAIGTAFQLLDDILDARRDRPATVRSCTYAAYLLSRNESLEPAITLLYRELSQGQFLISTLPHPHVLRLFLESLRGKVSSMGIGQ